jgi:hypothetical protein
LPGAKVSALVAGMVAGGDSIDDMRLLRHGAMGTLLARPYAPSTLGSFLREFRFGHVRQLDAVATRLLTGLCQRTRVRVLANKAHFEPQLRCQPWSAATSPQPRRKTAPVP